MIRLVTGGARSGKSKFAEEIYVTNFNRDVVYIATSKVMDIEMEERVKHHKDSRPTGWRTFEGNYNLTDAIGTEKYYLLDCITALISNIMYDISKDVEHIDYDMQSHIENTVMLEIKKLIDQIELKEYILTIVTNEVGNSIVPENHISRVFRDIQGRVNQQIAEMSDRVYLLCCGIPVKIK